MPHALGSAHRTMPQCQAVCLLRHKSVSFGLFVFKSEAGICIYETGGRLCLDVGHMDLCSCVCGLLCIDGVPNLLHPTCLACVYRKHSTFDVE